MAENYNKVVYGSKTLIDLTADTVTPETLTKDATAHDKTGAIIVGTSTKDSDTSDATVTVAEILVGKSAYARGTKLTGTMPDNGAITGEISEKTQTVTVPMGFHDGGGSVGISAAEQEKIIAANIKQGITILGIEGRYSGEGTNLQSKTATPTNADYIIQPDEGYDGLASVVVKAIPYTETENAAGGITVTIGA